MPLEIGQSVNRAAEWLCRSPAINGITKNVVFVALLLTVIAVVILLAVFRGAKLPKKNVMKFAFWVLVLSGALLAIHRYALESRLRGETENDMQRVLFSSIGGTGNTIRPEMHDAPRVHDVARVHDASHAHGGGYSEETRTYVKPEPPKLHASDGRPSVGAAYMPASVPTSAPASAPTSPGQFGIADVTVPSFK